MAKKYRNEMDPRLFLVVCLLSDALPTNSRLGTEWGKLALYTVSTMHVVDLHLGGALSA